MAEAVAQGEPLAGPTPPPSAPPAPAPVAVAKSVRTVYHASGGRRVAFSAIFLLLLPFFASLGPMLWARVSQGHWLGTPGLVVLAIGFTAIMGLILVELLHSIRTRVELGEKAVRLTLPSGRGPTPKLMYRTHEVPYADIEAIETRRELYGGALAPVLLKGSRLMLKDGTAIPLGYVSEANVDPAFPFNEIAERIAARAGLNVTDRGTVRRSVQKKMLGIKAGEDDGATIEQAMLDELNRRHYRLVLGIIGGLVALIAVGIVMDIVSETAPPNVAAPAATAPAKPAR
jgi:hypothetical protein